MNIDSLKEKFKQNIVTLPFLFLKWIGILIFPEIDIRKAEKVSYAFNWRVLTIGGDELTYSFSLFGVFFFFHTARILVTLKLCFLAAQMHHHPPHGSPAAATAFQSCQQPGTSSGPSSLQSNQHTASASSVSSATGQGFHRSESFPGAHPPFHGAAAPPPASHQHHHQQHGQHGQSPPQSAAASQKPGSGPSQGNTRLLAASKDSYNYIIRYCCASLFSNCFGYAYYN